jgi:hypothetical protein
MVMHAETSSSFLVLVPTSGEASYDSGSESRVYVEGGSGIGKYMFYCKRIFKFKDLCIANDW